MGLTKDNADGIKEYLINNLDLTQAGTIELLVSLNLADLAIIRAKEDARRWLAANRYKYENEMQAVEALGTYLTNRFVGKGYPEKSGGQVAAMMPVLITLRIKYTTK